MDAGRKAARLAALNGLAVARQYLGSLDRVTRIVRIGVSVATSGDVRAQPKVADGASELLQDIFGKDKNPSRLVYGVASLPLGAPGRGGAHFRSREVMGARWTMRLAWAISLMLASAPLLAQGKERPVEHPTAYRTVQIDGLSIFYREAGPKDAPTILLLHGIPSASRQFEPLFARLSDHYHLVAPDYPGFGHSDWPDPKKFAYTFDHIAEIMNRFTEALGLKRYTLYMHDYGGPVGFRMALAHPDRIDGAHRPGRRGARRGAGRELEGAQGVLGRSRRQRGACCARTSFRSRRRRPATSAAIRTSSATTRISGPTSSRFSASPPRPTSSATSSTTTARTSRRIRSGRPGCARSSRGCSSSGASTTSPSSSRSPRPTGKTCRRPRSTCSKRATSPSTSRRTRSRRSSARSCGALS